MSCQQGFVCSNNVFAGFERLEDEGLCRFSTADELNDNVNVRIVDNGVRISGEHSIRNRNPPVSSYIQISNSR